LFSKGFQFVSDIIRAVEYFKPKARDHIPEELTKENVEGDREAQPATDWGHHTAAQKLALAALIGKVIIKQVKMLKELI
jgi:hypothetical protein